MKKLVLLALGVAASAYSFGQSTWSLDKAHAKLRFEISHLMVSDVDGTFKSFESKITSAKDDFVDATIELTADANSITTDNEKRDEHIKSPDFIDAAKFPTVTFKSNSFKKVADKKYKVMGNLTLHGVTKPVELEATLNGVMKHPMNGKMVAGFKVTGKIKRSDFNIGATTPASVVGDDINIKTSLEYTKD